MFRKEVSVGAFSSWHVFEENYIQPGLLGIPEERAEWVQYYYMRLH